MHIQWYPGHMHKAAKAIRENLHEVDWFIELIDARIPYSGENPMIEEIRRDKPVLKLLTKCDLADPKLTQQWRQHWKETRDIDSREISVSGDNAALGIKQYAQTQFAAKLERKALVRAFVVGIPNVGKSTLINNLLGRKVAKTGNEAAVTKHQQTVDLGDGVLLIDTPGMLWPNIRNRFSGYRLGITGGIKDTVLDYEFLAEELLAYLVSRYPELLMQRYELSEDQLPSPEDDMYPLMTHIAKRRGTLISGGRPDVDRLSKILIHEFRSGEIGRATLETPAMIETELAEVERLEAEKAAKKAARKSKKRH